jgi:hypothetical protein
VGGVVVTAVNGPCQPWTPIWCAPCALPTASPAITGWAVQAATEVLWEQSRQRFGLCTSTVRPCRRDCSGGGWPFADQWWEWGTPTTWPRPVLWAGAWMNIACGSCPGTCSCTDLEEAILPAPVSTVDQVKVDGQVLPPSAYRVDNWRLLVRVDGGLWPVCQDLSKEDTQPGTWSITVTVGEAVPVLGQLAVGELACEMTRACLGEDCRLPANLASLARQGVNISFPTDQNIDDRLYFVRQFLDTVNPDRLRGRPAVYDVDGANWRTTGT